MLVLKRNPYKKSRLDSISYNPGQHTLLVRMFDQRLTYIGVPDSMYARMLFAETPDEIFQNDIYNKYPVVVSDDPKPARVKKQTKKRAK